MMLNSVVLIFITHIISEISFVMSENYLSDFYSPFESGKPHFVWNEALNVMSYHRNKMNEYLCKNYVAREIVENYRNRSSEKIDRDSGDSGESLKSVRLARDSMLEDPGSQKYKDWLSRSSTLEDIYRQFEHSESDFTGHHDSNLGHDGEVTGYALVGHKPAYSTHVEYGDDSYSHHGHNEEEDDDHDEKGLKLKELFHFALTAIAFLAFATFMIEVIMCLMETPQQAEPDYVLVPTTTGGTGHASKLETEIPEIHRHDRSLEMDPISLEMLNAMSSKVLSSIEAFAILQEDNGECLRRALCQNSKYSMTLPGIRKFWLPLWSLGASWITRRLSKEKDSLNTLEYLKATIMGLGSKECHLLYPKCDDRMRRRKKRKVND